MLVLWQHILVQTSHSPSAQWPCAKELPCCGAQCQSIPFPLMHLLERNIVSICHGLWGDFLLLAKSTLIKIGALFTNAKKWSQIAEAWHTDVVSREQTRTWTERLVLKRWREMHADKLQPVALTVFIGVRFKVL